jgi:hypothetical protein
MKFIKVYEAFDNEINEKIETFKDCFNDIIDDMFRVDFSVHHSQDGLMYPKNYIEVEITKDGSEFVIEELADSLNLPFIYGQSMGITFREIYIEGDWEFIAGISQPKFRSTNGIITRDPLRIDDPKKAWENIDNYCKMKGIHTMELIKITFDFK